MFALPATLTHREATATLKALQPAFAGAAGDNVRLDASALRDFDTSAVAVLLECRRLAHQAGRRLQIDGLPAPLLELARLYGVDGLLVDAASAAPRADGA